MTRTCPPLSQREETRGLKAQLDHLKSANLTAMSLASILPRDVQAFGESLVALLEAARAERLSVSLYRFSDNETISLEAHPASDFRIQHDGDLLAATQALESSVRSSRPQVREQLEATRLGPALVALLKASQGLTVFVSFYHPAGSEDSCRVEVVAPDPLRVVVNHWAPEALEALEGALASLEASPR